MVDDSPSQDAGLSAGSRLPATARAVAALVAAASLLAACATNPVSVSELTLAEVIQSSQISAFDGRGVSGRTLALLDRLALAQGDPAAAVEGLARPIPGLDDADRWVARSELQFDLGSHGGEDSAVRFLASALDALKALELGESEDGAEAAASLRLEPARHRALEAYGHALTQFLSTCIRRADGLPRLLTELRERHRIDVEWAFGGGRQIEDFDSWRCADTLQFEGLRHRYRRAGAGVPLVMRRDASRGIAAYLTPEAVTRAATALLLPSEREGRRGRLRILHPLRVPEVEVTAGLSVPLAADHTAAFGFLLSQARLHELENGSFFDADAAGHEGLYMLDDYDPQRRPVIMIHGLWSSPLTWRDLTNDIFGDSTLNRRYQVWHYMYATGVPLLENARQLRATLTRVRDELDPERDDFAMQGFEIVAHSMGGLLTRMALLDTGGAIWRALFEEEFGAVEGDLDEEDRRLARDLYFWESLDFIDRAIFIAAPHRGSELSDSWIGRLGSWLIKVPGRLRKLVDSIRLRSAVRVEVPTSVDELSGRHPVLRALAALKMRNGVVHHCIMGDVSGSKNPTEWTDGVVPFVSSRLAGASSHLLVPGADHNVHFDPRASAEVRRILRDTALRSRVPE